MSRAHIGSAPVHVLARFKLKSATPLWALRTRADARARRPFALTRIIFCHWRRAQDARAHAHALGRSQLDYTPAPGIHSHSSWAVRIGARARPHRAPLCARESSFIGARWCARVGANLCARPTGEAQIGARTHTNELTVYKYISASGDTGPARLFARPPASSARARQAG